MADSLHLPAETRERELQNLTIAAEYFLTQLEDQAKKQTELQEIFDRRAAERNEVNTAAIATNTAMQVEIQQKSLDVQQYVANLLADHMPSHTATPRNNQSACRWRNLPGKDYDQLVGRDRELTRIYSWLHPTSHHQIIAIEGIGGIGKSALALEVAHHYVDNYTELAPEERFEAVVWASAKVTAYTSGGPEPMLRPKTTLDRIYATIAVVLEDESITRAGDDERDDIVRRALVRVRTLIVVDNLDSVDDPNVYAFLRELPTPSKALVTTRVRQQEWLSSVQLEQWTRAELRSYLEQWPQARACLEDSHLEQLYTLLGGIPLALRLCFSAVERLENFERWLAQLAAQADHDVVSFCVQFNWQRLCQESKRACEVLKILTLFDPVSGATLEMVAEILDEDGVPADIGQEIVRISRQSLAIRKGDDRYAMLPLVQQHVSRYVDGEEYNRWRWRQMDAYLDQFLDPYMVHIDFVCGTEAARNDATETDNLELVLEWAQIARPDTDYLKFADGFSSLLYLVGFVNRAIEVASSALEIAQALEDLERVYDFYNKLGLYYTWSDAFEEAECMLQQAIRLSEQLVDYRRDNVLDYYGAYLMRRAQGTDLFDAYKYLRQSATIREQFDADGKRPACCGIGPIFDGGVVLQNGSQDASRANFYPRLLGPG